MKRIAHEYEPINWANYLLVKHIKKSDQKIVHLSNNKGGGNTEIILLKQ